MNINSLILIKNLLETIENENNKFPYLKKIIIQNKINLKKNNQTTNPEINNYLNNIKYLIDYELSYDANPNELLNKIIEAIYKNNKNKFLLPIDVISETSKHNFSLKNHNFNGVMPLKFIMLGDTCVGKTPFSDRYFKFMFSGKYCGTIGINKEIKYVKIYDNIYKITLWDTAGNDKFKCFPMKCCQNADGFLLLFDLTNKNTFDSIFYWIKTIKENSNQNKPLIYLIGNKVDLPNLEISTEEAEELAKSFGIKYFEISCKFNINIYEIMTRIILESISENDGVDEYLKNKLRKILGPRSIPLRSYEIILHKYINY